MGTLDHVVQFYEGRGHLIESIARFCNTGLQNEETVVVIATQPVRAGLERLLEEHGSNLSNARRAGQYSSFDAAELLRTFSIDGRPDETLFAEVAGGILEEAAAGARPHRVRVFAEMVVLLQLNDKWDRATHLERLWNGLAGTYSFSLLCAYPLSAFRSDASSVDFSEICREHTRVFPTEAFSTLTSSDEQLRTIASLQQRARALDAEVDERRQLARSLRHREQELSDFLENASEGLNKLDRDATILWTNQPQLQLLGFTEHEYVGHRLTEFIVDPKPFESAFARLLEGQTMDELSANLRCRDGSAKHVFLRCSPAWENGTRNLLYARCIVYDVTEHLENEVRRVEIENLTEADRQKDEFLAMLAHELRNPLVPIQLSVRLLRSQMNDRSAQRQLDTISRQADTLNRLVSDLLDVSRLLHAKVELRRERVEVGDALKRSIETTRALLEERRHKVTVAVPEQPVYISADPIRVEQILVNLIGNAAKYTERGGQVFVSVNSANSQVEVRVRDTGMGIAPEMLAEVFEPFQQAENGRAHTRGGLGLGLTIARRLIELHEGTIEAHSGGRGQGAEFIVRLPALT